MVAFSRFSAGLAAAASAVVYAHPGESHTGEHLKREIAARDHHAAVGARALGQCSNSATARRMKQRSVQRRAETVEALRKERGIKAKPKKFRRDLADLQEWETVNHNKTGALDYDMFTPLETVFDANTSCVLAPEITDGPYYVVGSYMRSNVKEAEHSEGVDLFLEVQYVDINTCGAIPNVAVDIWNCNATGVYSGVNTAGNYDSLDTTYLRGIQLTDHDGVAQFQTIFPGHYSGRATHTHLLSHTNAKVMPNGTISVIDTPVSHIGQLFFPEDLRTAVEATYPYNLNTDDATSNEDDMWSVIQADASYDPFPQFVYLGDDITDGLFAWIQIGVNASADYQNDEYYSVAAYLTEDGGVDSGVVFGPSGGDGGDSGSAPSGVSTGAAPSGTAAPTGTA